MIAVDTNVLVYAHRRDSEWHEPALDFVKELAESRQQWAIPWPCIHEFLAIVTHPKIYAPPSNQAQAIEQVETWLTSPSLVLISESDDHWNLLQELIRNGRVVGPMVHDARIAAICLAHGVNEFCSADRDFSRFPRLAVRNPLLE